MSNLTEGLHQSKSLEELYCSARLSEGTHYQLICLIVMIILLSVTAFLENALILVALHEESSLHPPTKLLFRCLATTDLCAGLFSEPLGVINLLSVVNKNWIVCRYTNLASFIMGYILASVSLFTVTAISVDRLLALLLGLRYRQVVTLKRTCIITIVFLIVSIVGTLMHFWNYLITSWYGYIGIPLCLVTSICSYTKIFLTLRQHRFQVQNHDHQEQQNRASSLNIERYRKAVSSALWIQLTLVVCYIPYSIADALMTQTEPSSSVYIIREFTVVLVFLNSSLNPILYCWKITEIRQAVKDTIRRFCCFAA